MLEAAVRRFDEVQQDRRWLAEPVAVIRKYADDRGSALAGLVTFNLFLGLLPLLVVVLTVLGYSLVGSDAAQQAAIESTLGRLPVVGAQIAEDVSGLRASGPWLAIAALGLLWTASGIYHSLQLALNQVWNVEGVERQGFVSRHVRALILFTLVFTAAIGTGLLRLSGLLGTDPPLLVRIVVTLLGVAVVGLVLLATFALATGGDVPPARLAPAAAVAAVAWEVLQRAGTWLVVDRLERAQALYGSIGLVVVTLGWLNLLARSALLSNEWAVVRTDRLWPRRLAQPPLTEADREVLARLARNERRRPEQHIEVSFDQDADS